MVGWFQKDPDCLPEGSTPDFAIFQWIKQHFPVPKEADVREATVRELKKLFPDTTAIKGKIVGLTCPSRGIRDIAQVLITAVSFLKPHCKEVRILTAMGTHGGGTSEGERAMASD